MIFSATFWFSIFSILSLWTGYLKDTTIVLSSMDFGLALLSKAAAGVRRILSGASLINCLQLMVSRSISLPASDGARRVLTAGVVSGSGSGAGSEWASDSDAVGAGSGEMDGSGVDDGGGGGSDTARVGSGLAVGCFGVGGVTCGGVVLSGCLVSA